MSPLDLAKKCFDDVKTGLEVRKSRTFLHLLEAVPSVKYFLDCGEYIP